MLRAVKWALLALAAVLMAAVAWDVATYDRAAWRADYEHLKRELAQRYANLDWIAAHRRLDLRKLDAETAAAIDGAHSRALALLALRRFVRSFADPHLKLVFAERAQAAPVASTGTVTEPTAESCEAMGYEDDDHSYRMPFDRLAGWKVIRSGNFPTGIVADLGVLRIAAFGEDRYLATCRAIFRSGRTAREVQLMVRANLNEELRRALAELKAQGARRLLVDITGNGGGTEWVIDVVAMLTDRDLTRQASRHVDPACDRSAVWRAEPVCSVFAPEGEPESLKGTGEWTASVFILMDRNTGSASEDFAVWLKENGVAQALGDRTAGAGCGYTGGGGRIVLQTAPFDVMAPNCARFLKDGTNEIEGIKPDVELPMTADGDELAVALGSALRLRLTDR